MNSSRHLPDELEISQLAVERIFLETSVQLVCEGSSDLSDRQAEALEKLTFDWILNAEKYVDVRFSELYKAREKVTTLTFPLFLKPGVGWRLDQSSFHQSWAMSLKHATVGTGLKCSRIGR